jgi:hypothetical protein
MAASTKRYSAKKTEWSFVHLSVGGKYLDPEKVSKAIGIFPDACGKRGEPVAPNSKRRCKAGFWGLESDQLNWRIETQMKNILKRITPVKERLRRLIREDTTIEQAYLTIAFSPPEGRPAVSYLFPSELVSEFVSLGLDIVLSIYFYKHVTPVRESTTDNVATVAKKGGRNR